MDIPLGLIDAISFAAITYWVSGTLRPANEAVTNRCARIDLKCLEILVLHPYDLRASAGLKWFEARLAELF